MTKSFNDPLFSSQWYLINTGQRGGTSRLDINVLSAWDKYTGKGVIVAVNDDGMDLTHPSLVANLLTGLTYDTVRDTTGQGFVGAGNSHGTVVGSIVGMAGNDGIGGVGVAYGSKIVPGLAIASGVIPANLFLANLAAGASVSVNSWGSDPAFSENFGLSGEQSDKDWGAALLRAANEARGGLGMVIEVSGGNERGNNADTAMSNFTGNKLTIAVGAVTETGVHTDYSTAGASLLITAPGGVSGGDQSLNSGFGIVSADVQSTMGYNNHSGAEGDYAYQNQGTSYSGPMVGGAAALMLEANPKLGFRDVSTILAMTAKKVDAINASWVQNNATNWNLGGMHFSRDYGYGLLDVSAAVRLAESWSQTAGTMANWASATGTSGTAPGSIPDNNTNGKTVVATVSNGVRIERMEFELNLSATSPSQLSATITSPSGTTVTLFDRPLTRGLKDGQPDMSSAEPGWPDTFTIGSTSFLGESSAGTWTLKLTDKVSGVESSYNSFTVRAWGSALSDDSVYVFTNEFDGAGLVLTDAKGVDTVNASATDSTVTLDLRAGQTSKAAKGQFTLAQGTVIENAIGGLGNDMLVGNEAGNLLRGNGGDDLLDGGAGIDTALFTGSSSGYTLSLGNKIKVSDKSSLEGTDTLTNIERLQFSDRTVTIESKSHASYADLPVGLYQFFITAFNAAPGVTYMDQLAEAYSYGLSVKQIVDIFTTKSQFTDVYPTSMSTAQLAQSLVNNIVKTSATDTIKLQAVKDITDAMTLAKWTVGQVIFQVFGNLANYAYGDPVWGNTAKQFANQIAVAKVYTDTFSQSTTDLPTLRSVMAPVSHLSDVSTPELQISLIGQALLA
jgi:subtilisin-like proprotein convertase family protein